MKRFSLLKSASQTILVKRYDHQFPCPRPSDGSEHSPQGRKIDEFASVRETTNGMHCDLNALQQMFNQKREVEMVTRHKSRASNTWQFFCVVSLFVLACSSLESQTANSSEKVPSNSLESISPTVGNSSPLLPAIRDEYTELDEQSVADDPMVNVQLEKARQYYLKALKYLEKEDSTRAQNLFESALDVLNDLVSTPGIDQNENFTDLAQSIIEDYESYISTERLDQQSSLFILREKLLREVDAYTGKTTYTIIKASETVAQNLQTTIPLPMNELVQKHMSFFTQGAGKKFISRWIERTGRWFPLLKQVARDEGVPEEIVHLAMIESGLNPNAVSRAKAVGMWQFIRSTGEMYDLKVSFYKDDRRNVEKASRAAMRHLRDLYNELGDWHLALAAYNCGLGGVRRAMRQVDKPNPNFWDLTEKLPRETRNYVPLFIATTLIESDPEAYGFDKSELNMGKPYLCDTIKINECVNFKALAKCAGISIEVLKEYNPDLLKECTPPGESYNLRLPTGVLNTFADNFSKLAPEDKLTWKNHFVKKGESLETIAREYGVSSSDIVSANNLEGFKTKLKRGTSLLIPFGGDPVPPALVALVDTSASVDGSGNPVAPQSQDGTVAKPKASITHVIQNNETLFSIAQRYGVRLTDVRNWNNIPFNSDRVLVGSALTIFDPKTTQLETNNLSDRTAPAVEVRQIERATLVKHKVRRGETLAQVADDYGVTMQSIKEANKVGRRGLQAGQVLLIKSSKSRSETTENIEPVGKKHLHIVRAGQSLGTISALYSVSEDDIKTWNKKTVEGNTVFIGTKLVIYSSASGKGSAPAPGKTINRLPKSYRVRSGETLSSIAKKFGLTVESIQKKNRLSGEIIKSGLRLRLQ